MAAKASVMMGQCPLCAFKGRLIEFCELAEANEHFLNLLDRLPMELRCGDTLRYLNLFSPEKRALSADKARDAADELLKLVSEGTVSYYRNVHRAPASLWAESIHAIFRMHPDKWPKSLQDHSYLVKICWNKAEEIAQGAEAKKDRSPEGKRDEGWRPEEIPEGERASLRDLSSAIGEMLSSDREQKKNGYGCRHFEAPRICRRDKDAIMFVNPAVDCAVCEHFKARIK